MSNYKNNNIPRHVIGNSNILPQTHANQSYFDLSEDLKTTLGFDYLYPILWEEMNPGDKFDVSTKTLARLMPMVAPTMSNIKMKYFSFFVPNRLLWKDWTKFMGEKVYQSDSSDFTVPKVRLHRENSTSGSITDYLGIHIPPDNMGWYDVSALPYRAYTKIWNDWFMAKEIEIPRVECSDGHSDYTWCDYGQENQYQLLKKGKPLDYFTSCLPYPQAGEPVMIPLTGDAPVLTTDEPTRIAMDVYNGSVLDGQDIATINGLKPSDVSFTSLGGNMKGFDTKLYADMSSVTGVSIEMLRKASALQVLLEKDARAGESYIELMNAHYSTTVPDFLVGRSQFLGSSTTMLNVEPIAQTGGTNEMSPQGNLVGVGIGVNGDKLCEISAVEHGIFMIMACVEGELSYSQGIPRKFDKTSRYDYMFPEFHNLGDQAVLNREIFISGDETIDNQVFGYQERYRELRESTNKISGKMRVDIGSDSLAVWHLGQKFANTPTLSSDFISLQTPIDRVMSVPTEDQVLLNVFFDIKATRTLPVTSNPSILAGRV